MSIGENIRYLRKQAGLTQKKLAESVGVNEVTIRSYEAGKYEPKTEVLYKLCKVLNCNINEILDKPFELYDYVEITYEDLKLKILRNAFNQLNEKGQDKAVEQVKLLTKIPEYQSDTMTPEEVIVKIDKHDDLI